MAHDVAVWYNGGKRGAPRPAGRKEHRMYTRDEFNEEILKKAAQVATLAEAAEEDTPQLVELIGRARSHQAHGELADMDSAVDQLYRALITQYVDRDQLPAEAPGRLTAPPVDSRPAADQIVDAAEGLVEELSQLLNQVSLAVVLEDSGARADALAELRATLVELGIGLPELPPIDTSAGARALGLEN